MVIKKLFRKIDEYSEEKLIVNGWSESDCTYIITTKCKLEHSDGPY